MTSECTEQPLSEIEVLREENARLRGHLSLLGRLTYRVGSGMDLPLVLQEVVDAACELTGARCGALTLVDETGRFQRLFGHGLSEQQREKLSELPREDSPTGQAEFVTTIQDQGTVEGSLYVADKAGGRSFSREDKELLTVLAQQAGAAIRNARRFGEEHRARAEAEAAQETSRVSEAQFELEMKDLERLRTDLLAAIAHEFRTPLTAIRTAIGILQDPALSATHAQEKRLLQAISQSATLMQRLVTDFVDLARFQSGVIRLEPRRFEARGLAKEAVRALNALFVSRHQSVVINAPKKPLWVEGDRRRLEQALLNLLANAQKYAPEGSTITVTTAVQGKEAVWTVADEGPGIPKAAQPHLFERFFTLPEADSGESIGTGLGLPIAMAIAIAHGGTIDVESSPGGGTTFTLRVAANVPPDNETA